MTLQTAVFGSWSSQDEEVTLWSFEIETFKIALSQWEALLNQFKNFPNPFWIVICEVPIQSSRQSFWLLSIQKLCLSLFLPTSSCLPSTLKLVMQTPFVVVPSSWNWSLILSIWFAWKQCSNSSKPLEIVATVSPLCFTLIAPPSQLCAP